MNASAFEGNLKDFLDCVNALNEAVPKCGSGHRKGPVHLPARAEI
jgi:hypothetical protein